MTNPKTQFYKDLHALEKVLRAAEYAHAGKALGFARRYHGGLRKDGITPNFHHQVEIAFSLYDDRKRLEAGGLDPDIAIAAGILHDTPEDNPFLPLADIEREFNTCIAATAELLNKNRNGKLLSAKKYFEKLLNDPYAIIVKLHDRRNNMETILGLPPEAQAAWILETILLLKIAKKAL